MLLKSNLLFLSFLTFVFAMDKPIHHELKVELNPSTHKVEVTDEIILPAGLESDEMFFLLHSNLKLELVTEGIELEVFGGEIQAGDFGMDQEEFELSSDIKQKKYVLKFEDDLEAETKIILKYQGEIFHPVQQLAEEYARGFSTSPGIISDQGVYLAGSSYWVPWFNDQLVTFNLTVSVPDTFDVVSQGKRTLHKKKTGKHIVRWESPEQMEEVFLIAANFSEYTYAVGKVDAMAFLRTPDENLANKYLETTAQYLEMYRQLVGPFPFAKFALVENFWETGYGMPSFTLLGERIIRFPFILHSSYPHELLHNWWGNSVYVDFGGGNWCEGLTAYMADHLIKEQRGQGADYRRNALQRYTDYVTEENDFPLNEFKSRYNAPSEAVGYGKSMMMWEMLRNRVGDDLFVKGFQKFYKDFKFKKASFDDIRGSFEEVSGNNLESFFDQWVNHSGAPELRLSEVRINNSDTEYLLMFTLSQIQNEDTYKLEIPVAVYFEDDVEMHTIKMNERKQNFRLTFARDPLKIQIDPQFNIFRRLHYNEIPPALSKIFGSEKILIILPKSDTQPGYQQLADIWSKDKSKDIIVKREDEIGELPSDRAVWIFGNDNRYAVTVLDACSDYDMESGGQSIRLGKTELDRKSNSILVSARHPQNPNSVITLLTLHDAKAVPGLARKLPHYGKYSYLAFEGDEPTNIAKGQWPSIYSPLQESIPQPEGVSFTLADAELPARQPLARLAPVFSADRMMEHVKYLASEQMQGRGLGSEGLEKAAKYIAEAFAKIGLQPGGENESYFQTWEEVVDNKGTKKPIKNVIGILPGSDPNLTGESVVVSAHYDHLGLGWPDARKGNEGKIHYGADDNASGVAVMLELAQVLSKSLSPKRTVIFVAFTAEESGLKGARHYVETMQTYPVSKVIGALNLDTVGRLGKNKLLVLNSSSAREWKFIFMGSSYVTGVESEMVTQDLDASDQVAFIEAGIPAVQFFSGPNTDYHRPSDTIDKIDQDGMVKVASFVREAIVYLAEREEPMSFTGVTASSDRPVHKAQGKQGERRVSTGSMPDFTFSGEGVRLQSVAPDSPAEKAGLVSGDVIISLASKKVTNLKDYSAVLKSFQPGDEVDLVYQRKGKDHSTKIILSER